MEDDLIFITVDAEDEVFYHFAKMYSIDLTCDRTDQIPIDTEGPIKFIANLMATDLTRPNPNSQAYKRSPLVFNIFPAFLISKFV